MHDRELNEVLDTIVVDLDGGAVTLPENYTIYKVRNNFLPIYLFCDSLQF